MFCRISSKFVEHHPLEWGLKKLHPLQLTKNSEIIIFQFCKDYEFHVEFLESRSVLEISRAQNPSKTMKNILRELFHTSIVSEAMGTGRENRALVIVLCSRQFLRV